MEKQQVLEVVRQKYAAIARGEQSGCGCGSNDKETLAVAVGYSKEDLALAGDGNLGLRGVSRKARARRSRRLRGAGQTLRRNRGSLHLRASAEESRWDGALGGGAGSGHPDV